MGVEMAILDDRLGLVLRVVHHEAVLDDKEPAQQSNEAISTISHVQLTASATWRRMT